MENLVAPYNGFESDLILGMVALTGCVILIYTGNFSNYNRIAHKDNDNVIVGSVHDVL